MREDLVGGLKNALERGVSLEAAIQSFITAGYKDTDVREAARDLDTGSVYMEQAAKPVASPLSRPLPVMPQPTQRPAQRPQPQYQPPRPQTGNGSLILVTVLAIILVLSVAAFIASILFREQIAAFFT